MAAWEVLLRLDSRVISTSTKVWLLPLLFTGVVIGGAAVGTVIGHLVAARRVSSRLHLALLATATAVVVAAEYVGVMHYHAPESVKLWPIAAIAGATFALLTHQVVRRFPASRAKQRIGFVRSRAHCALAVGLLGLGVAVYLLADRVDVTTCLIRKNTVLGRVIGRMVALPRPFLPTAIGEGVDLPDRPARSGFGDRNVFIISVDTLRTDTISPYGSDPGRTPHLQNLAEDSVVFDEAFVSRPSSAPSMASMLTGLYPANHRVRDNLMLLPDDVTTMAETFAAWGYRTAAFVANRLISDEFNFDQGFSRFEFHESTLDADGLMTDSGDLEVADAAVHWISKHARERIFVWVHLMSPHSPYMPPPETRPALTGVGHTWLGVLNMPAWLARVEGRRTYFDRGAYLRLYEAEVTHVDRLIGQLLHGLKAAGVFEDGHVIFMADHGEAFGEADVFGHGWSLHVAETRVPLMWKLPGRLRRGSRIRNPVQLVDLFPTLCDMTGKPRPRTDGRVISAILRGEAPEDEGFAFTEAGVVGWFGAPGQRYAARSGQRSIWLDTGFGYTMSFDRSIDLQEERWRRYEPRVGDRLFNSLVRLAAVAEAERRPADGPALDERQKAYLRALGYVR